MAAKTHFTVTIPSIPGHVGGTITCTEPAPQVYLLTLASPPDNRLTPPLCAALLESLDRVEFGEGFESGVLVTTSAMPKFYSNGLDLQLAMSTPGFTEDSLYPLFRRFLTYPMPTVALVNGHCFAGGSCSRCTMITAFSAAGRAAPGGGVQDAGAGGEAVRREGGAGGGDCGWVGGWEDGVMRLVEERGLRTKGKMGVYGMLKEEMYRGQVALLDARGGGGG
ncbi:ClpP/crotonase [Apiospora rasikravindrae]|uniref:ClpP/crotonase n=1 Tax=Apiospora rasikravindrae TaxID=990691 RepID=A0ABR1TCJ3_9PEZI